MNIQELEEKLSKLLILESNLKKSINTKYLFKTLLQKKNYNKELYKSIQISLFRLTEVLTEAKYQYFKESSEKAYNCIQQILNTKLINTKPTITFKLLVKIIIILRRNLTNIKMANATEMIKIASSLIPQYDGNGEKLSNIISALTALKTVSTAATEPIAVQIVLSKLEKKARSAVGEAPANIDAIVDSLKRKCKQHISADVVLAKLNATRQNGALNKFSSEIEELTNQLETAYINDEIPIDTATKMANKAGIKALANGLKNVGTQMIIKSGTFSNLNEAIGRTAENDNDAVLHE